MKLRNLFLALAGTLLLALTALAQMTYIEGNVVGDDGKSLQNAIIKIIRTDIKGNYQTKTDKKGHYYHAGLSSGSYDVVCEVNGKPVDKRNGVRITVSSPAVIDFDLQKVAQALAVQEAAIQAGQITPDMTKGMSKEDKDRIEAELKSREGAIKKNAELNAAFTAGMTAVEQKNFAEAVTQFTKASELDAKQSAVWIQLAEAYFNLAGTKQGDEKTAAFDKGSEAYLKAIELKPTEAGFHNNYALALAKAKRIPQMQDELKKAAEIDPANAGKYYYNMGAVLTNIGQSDAAVEAFKKAIELQPNYPDAYYQYGVALLSKATIAADGKMTAVAGTAEAFNKYLELAPTGTFSADAKSMLTTLGASVSTSFRDPNAPVKKQAAPATKKK